MKRKKRLGLVFQLDLMLLLSLVLCAVFTFISQYRIAQADRKRMISILSREIADEMTSALKEYPAYRWLLRYWYENADKMVIEYDADFKKGTATEAKCRIFAGHHPDIQLKYASTAEIEALSPQDQKLYAEIIYSWLVTRVNQIKRSYHIDFLYFMVTEADTSEHPYSTQFFLLSGADKGAKRGTGRYDVYPAGTVINTEENKINVRALREAVESARDKGKNEKKVTVLDDSGYYIDAYVFVDWIGVLPVLAGMSFNIQNVMHDIAVQTKDGTLDALFYQVVLLQMVMLLLYFFVVRPLKEVLENIRFFTQTKDGEKVRKNIRQTLSGPKAAAARSNEIGQLADDFIDLTEEIDHHVNMIETITADKKKIEVELNLAAEIQADMLPSHFPAFPGRTEFDLYATMDPAREVGGDFYDFFLVDDDHLALVIADVSGKGVPAALFMVIAKTLIKNHALAGEHPKNILRQVNRQLCNENEKGFFVTSWLAIVEISTGKGVAVNAGHEHPALCRSGGVFELVRYRHDPALAMLPEASFSEHEFTLCPGDRLFVYTDGVPESMNSDRRPFGTDRMLEALNHDPEAPLKDLLQHLKVEMDFYSAGVKQFDDITMLCFWYKGSEKDKDQ